VRGRKLGPLLLPPLPPELMKSTHRFRHRPMNKGDQREKLARDEKAASLQTLAEAQFSVLIGPAGTGSLMNARLAWPEKIRFSSIL
jgi:hypothetical protein